MSGGDDGLDLRPDFTGALLAVFALLLQRAEDDFVNARVTGGFGGGRGELAEGEFAGEHLVEDDAEAVDVGAVVHVGGAVALLGGHVAGRAQGGGGGGERGGAGMGDGVWRLGRGVLAGGVADEFGDAEVHEFHAAFGVEEDVLGLDVAVEDALVVGVLEGFANLRDDGEGLGGGEAAGAEGLAEVRAVHVFHEQVVKRGMGDGVWGLGCGHEAEVVDGDDVGVAEAGEEAAFALEAGGEGGGGAEVGWEEFEGDETIELRLAGLEDVAHAAGADEFEDFELREGGGDLLTRGRRGARGGSGAGLGGFRDGGEEARGTEALRGVGGQGGVALRAGGGGRWLVHVTGA